MENRPLKQSTLTGADEACKFCEIARGSKEAYVVFQDKNSIAFLDYRPLFPGHLLLIPKAHYGTIDEMPKELVGSIFNNAKLLSGAVEKGMDADGTFIALNNKVSQSVMHLHIHIVPRKFKDGLKGFFWPRYKYGGNEEMAKVQEKIVASLKN